jgi:hypothetical protein
MSQCLTADLEWRNPTGRLFAPNSPPPTPELLVRFILLLNAFPYLSYFASDLFSSVLESQVQALHATAATATNTVNAWGDTIVAHLQDIPSCVREVAGHGVRQGSTVALAIVQNQTCCDLRLMELIFLEGEEQEEFTNSSTTSRWQPQMSLRMLVSRRLSAMSLLMTIFRISNGPSS